jgi:DNA methylase N-4/N-6
MKKLAGESLNIMEENLAAMQQLFPEAFEEGKIDFDVLRQLLGDYVDDEEERYSFRWNGKGKALRLSQTPSTGTLRPCKEESKDWNTTENLYIEGDNLEVLKLLQKSYHGKVKMIYIDKSTSRMIQVKWHRNALKSGGFSGFQSARARRYSWNLE